MPYYEIIYENGDKSVAFYEDEEEAGRALTEHHNRAKSGLSALSSDPKSPAASRVTRVLEYEQHPADYGVEQSFSADEAKATMADLIDKVADENGVVSKYDLAAAIHETSAAIKPLEDQSRHESQYKMQEKRELKSSLWGEK